MFKNKLIAAGILSISALAFSMPAMASSYFSNKNYAGRYACHEDDATGSQATTPVIGGVTASYVVDPNGWGAYSGGDLVLNISALFGDNPCTFSLNTYDSSYWVDSSGVVHEDLVWYDGNDDYCEYATFYHYVEGSLMLISPYAAATESLTTANTNLAWLVGLDLTGSGACTVSAN